jgi:hypothetical protein
VRSDGTQTMALSGCELLASAWRDWRARQPADMPALALVRCLSARTAVHVSAAAVPIRVLVLGLIRVRVITPGAAKSYALS